MLRSVHIKNLALIREAEMEFLPGLNILTGETGAGKSIMISSINLALGEKANKAMIRKDSDYGFVELLFTGIKEEVLAALKTNDIVAEDTNLIITRKITPDLSISKINGQNVTLHTLKEITSLLADIHGQHEHQSLLSSANHIHFLDAFGGKELEEIHKDLKEEHAHYKLLRNRYKAFDKTEEDLNAELQLLRYEIREIDAAELKEKEDDLLEAEYKKLSNSEKLVDILSRADAAFNADGNSLNDRISDALKDLNEAVRLDMGLSSLKDALADLESVSKDIGRQISHALSDHEFDPERYHQVRERLDVINHLKSKYGNSLEQIFAKRTQQEEKLHDFDTYFQQKAELEKEIHDSGMKLNELSYFLSEKRKAVAAVLEPLIRKNLEDLNFPDSRFEVQIEKLERITENGFDKVEFLISTNPGEPLRPLAKVASGGELSRVMLAIKSAVAEKDRMGTLIFDEIDTGISGKTAQMVAQKLFELSGNHQVICISHLPQIAAMADSHFHIHKEVEDGNTISGIVKLDEEQTVYEIAKLLGGTEVTPAALENARDLKGNANFFKRKLK